MKTKGAGAVTEEKAGGGRKEAAFTDLQEESRADQERGGGRG